MHDKVCDLRRRPELDLPTIGLGDGKAEPVSSNPNCLSAQKRATNDQKDPQRRYSFSHPEKITM
jgi:uncharacterized protein (DUF1499 family)